MWPKRDDFACGRGYLFTQEEKSRDSMNLSHSSQRLPTERSELEIRGRFVCPLGGPIKIGNGAGTPSAGILCRCNRARSFSEELIFRTCSTQLQQKLHHVYLARQVLNNRGQRGPEMAMLKALVCPGDSVADIGANLGVYTKDLSSLVGPNELVCSYDEPINENYQILESVVRKARLSNVRLCQAAVGLRVGERQMAIPDPEHFTGYQQAHFSKGRG